MYKAQKGMRKTPNDGQGKSGKSLPSPGMMNPKTMPSKGGANKGPALKKSKGMGC